MKIVQTSIDQVPMMIGDLLACHGDTGICRAIIETTHSPVSHVATICETQPKPLAIEAHEPAVSCDDLHALLNTPFDRVIWLLPLSPEARSQFNLLAFASGCRKMVNTQYDIPQAIGAGILDWLGDPEWLRKWLKTQPDVSRVFCSELIVYLYQQAGIWPMDINASMQTPGDVIRYGCAHGIFADTIYQLKGDSPLNILKFIQKPTGER